MGRECQGLSGPTLRRTVGPRQRRHRLRKTLGFCTLRRCRTRDLTPEAERVNAVSMVRKSNPNLLRFELCLSTPQRDLGLIAHRRWCEPDRSGRDQLRLCSRPTRRFCVRFHRLLASWSRWDPKLVAMGPKVGRALESQSTVVTATTNSTSICRHGHRHAVRRLGSGRNANANGRPKAAATKQNGTSARRRVGRVLRYRSWGVEASTSPEPRSGGFAPESG